jgi:hypothetical protein
VFEKKVLERKVFKVLVGTPKEGDHSEDPRCRSENGIRMDLREIG